MKSPKFASCDKGDLIRGNAAGDGCVYVVPVVSICGGGALFDTGDFGVMYCGDTILPLYCAEGAEHEVAVVVAPPGSGCWLQTSFQKKHLLIY